MPDDRAEARIDMSETVLQTRNQAIMNCVEMAQRELMPGETVPVVICVGPPVCNVLSPPEGYQRGCPHCSWMTVGAELARA